MEQKIAPSDTECTSLATTELMLQNSRRRTY
jgi:hypothetical protein